MSKTEDIISNIKFSKNHKPQTDFYKYVNGVWEDEVKIPDDYTGWGVSYVLFEETTNNLKKIVNDISDKSKNHDDKLIKCYYDSFMNMDKRNKLGLTPLGTFLSIINDKCCENNQYELFALFTKCGFKNLFYIYAEPDSKDSEMVRPYIFQGGLGLPEKEYYFDSKFKDKREYYINLIKNVFILLEYSTEDSKKIAENIFNIEKDISKQWFSPEEHRNVDNTYNMISRDDFFNNRMATTLKNIGITDKIIIDNLKYTKYVENLLEKTDLRNYFVWKLIASCSSYLDQTTYDLFFNFYNKELRGQKKPKPLWMRSLFFIDSTIGEALSKKYVEKYFPPSSKKKMLELVDNLKKSLKYHIENLDWMESKTKAKALKKLSKFKFKIGYPDKFIDYSSIKPRDTLFDNMIESSMFDYRTEIVDRLEKKMDKNRWEMLPHTINAYFYPELNEIVFPAAILQPPYFDPNADDSFNYGGIGATIGHEMTHGYDDQGRKYDHNGNLNDWWTENDAKKYNNKAKKIVQQYNQYKLYDVNVNGDLTQGENIADLGGLKISYTAFLNANKNATLQDKKNFFITYAFSWRDKETKDSTINSLVTDEHSPAIFRVNGPLYNCEEFFETFCCREGDKMFNENVIKIW